MTSSVAFERLEPRVKRWIWKQGWTALRDVQERAIATILDKDGDVIIGAATAGGKTEAAFLPIVSELADMDRPDVPSFEVLALSPLKALINDQARRLEELCEAADVPLHKWHGDVAENAKQRARRHPGGILIITPESLEAMFVLRGPDIARLFAKLRFIVVDELHAFLVSERGVHLQSLMHRVERTAGTRAKRIGLSATLGDMQLAARALRPDDPEAVSILEISSDEAELKLQIRGYQAANAQHSVADEDNPATDREEPPSVRQAIADHLLKVLRGKSNLVFAGARQTVELYADRLRQMCDDTAIPNEFFPHHGSLAKELRHDVETRLREGRLPTTAVCTTTLELGIDIGDVESVAQIGPPFSIAALRQRLGRSGRRPGKPAVLRIYIEEAPIEARLPMLDRLRLDTVLSVAAVRLLLAGWCEPPPRRALHLSTLLHQVLSIIRTLGGVRAGTLYRMLCETGPFCNVPRELFVHLLRQMGESEIRLIEQAPDGTLLLGSEGERVVERHTFYAVFETPEEYRIVANGKTLGTVPIDFPLYQGALIIFAGRRWEVIEIHDRQKVVEVRSAKGGIPPRFGGQGVGLHSQIVQEMRNVFNSTDQPQYLNAQAHAHLEEGREIYTMLDLENVSRVAEDKTTMLFPWVGGRRLTTLIAGLNAAGLSTNIENAVIFVNNTCDEVEDVLTALSKERPPTAIDLARRVANKRSDKFDRYLDDDLLAQSFAAAAIDIETLPQTASTLLSGKRQSH